MSRLSFTYHRGYRGAAAVEFSIVLSILLLLLLGVADFGRVLYAKIVVEGAAEAGALYGTRLIGAYTDTTGITAAALADRGGLTGMTVTSTYSCICNAGGDNCSVCNSSGEMDPTPYVVLTVNTEYTFQPVVANFPGLPSNVVVRGSASMRAQ